MARPRKVLKNATIFATRSIVELKELKNEVVIEIRVRERELSKTKSEETARKIRNKIRIGSKISFYKRGAGGKIVKSEVIGIFADKVQVEVDSRKRSVALTRVINVE